MPVRNGCGVGINFLPDDARGPRAVAKLGMDRFSAIEASGHVSRVGDAEAMIDAVGPLDRITEELWGAVIETNLIGVSRCSKAAAPALKQAHGAIVSFASISGLSSPGSSLAYGASKAAVINLTRNLARGLGPEIRANAVAPGSVDSTWQIQWTEDYKQQAAERAALKRRCLPDDIAEVIVFLGFGAAMVTGQTVVVDAGLTR